MKSCRGYLLKMRTSMFLHPVRTVNSVGKKLFTVAIASSPTSRARPFLRRPYMGSAWVIISRVGAPQRRAATAAARAPGSARFLQTRALSPGSALITGTHETASLGPYNVFCVIALLIFSRSRSSRTAFWLQNKTDQILRVFTVA